SAIQKAFKLGQTKFSDVVYSSVPASDYGFDQLIRISFMSGKSNIRLMLEKLNIEPDLALLDYILSIAKKSRKQIDYEDLKCLVAEFRNKQ
ncbi:MAG: hypothetical protein K8S87_03100, partial [Planctomycetes bacterium]|nr:hypothetical protein [Planctomycetota bacterium]